MQALEVIKLVNNTFKPFSGDPSELGGFLINVDVCKEAIPPEHQRLAIKCIRGRLTGNASALVQDSVVTYEGLVSALKDHIKADPSKVVESKLAAIVFDNRNLTKFTDDVNALAEKLTSTYISEKIPLTKANEMTISLVVETCRKSTRNDLVKSVLASSHFETPKGVLSKFVTEVANQNKDKQFLAYRQEFNPCRGNGYQRGGFGRRNWSNNDQFQNNRPPSNYQWRGNSNGSQPSNRGGNFRPRGNFSRTDNRSVRTLNAEESENM